MVSQLYLDHEECLGPGNLANKDDDSSVPPSSEDHADLQMPAVKKVTRQWAAWTRSEEESFFAALRQVGKNFEKITCHVQSKNKDQVRHYYYRLVRRMNKMLGPELFLDPKNSKDTNAAMLRWWSLLEKYRCKASKLHLKPRRFKIFIETLENQLLKDRKKNMRKRLATGETKYSTVHNPVSNQARTSGHGNRAAKVVLVDRQNIQKVGNGKRSLPKCHINMGTNRKSSEAEPTTSKAAKKRRKTGLASTAEYKSLEEVAIAGVSLVADAAEYLEQGDSNKEIVHVQETPGHDSSQHVTRGLNSLPVPPKNTSNDHNIHNNGKLKLQLFPIDECTRKTLEMDHHNPHLELTLSTWKKISSVLEHLNRKWGNSNLLSQELMLFPNWAQRENLLEYQKWTKDSPLCAADIYYLIGSPPVFRLRYGWFSKAEVESATAQAMICNNLNEKTLSSSLGEEQNVETENPSGPCSEHIISTELITTLAPSSRCIPINTVECGGSVSNINVAQYHDNPAFVSSLGTQHGALAVKTHFGTKETALSAGEWADSTTNISVGDLLSESTHEMDINYNQFPVPVGSNSLQQIPFSCDSFDAAIAAYLHKHQNKADPEQSVASHGPSSPSIWDAEETCDAFSFQRNSAICDKGYSTSTPSPFPSHKEVELLEGDKLKNNTPTCRDMMDDCMPDHIPENSNKDSGVLTDIYWPDCLGSLDLDIPLCGYNSDDLILSDSIGGMNRLIANSLDAFQSCSLFGLDKKEPASTAEAPQITSFPDFKLSSEV